MCKNGECHIYSFAFDGGIIRVCVFVHHYPGALDLLHDGWEETVIRAGQGRRGMERPGEVRRSMAGQCRKGAASKGLIRRGLEWQGRLGQVWTGMV